MKINFLLFLICVVSFVTSCTEPKGAKDKQKETTESISIADEDFAVFLQNFNKNPTFQRQRVMFPLEAVLLDPSEYGMTTLNEKITYQEWILLDFTYDSTHATRLMDGYVQDIRRYNDSTIIEHRGIDNGIYANYYFKKKDGKWFLKSFTDVSY